MPTEIEKITQNPAVVEFLAQPHLARLATADPLTAQPHVVPVWYVWDGAGVWVSTFRATLKVRQLEKNPRYSLVIDTDQRGEAARGVLMEGKARIIEDAALSLQRGFEIYVRYLGVEGAQAAEPQSWLHDPQTITLYLPPEKVSVWGL